MGAIRPTAKDAWEGAALVATPSQIKARERLGGEPLRLGWAEALPVSSAGGTHPGGVCPIGARATPLSGRGS